jgi:hypothetical protein
MEDSPMLMTEVKADHATAVAAVPPREFLSTLVWIKADGAATAGTQSLIEILAPAGWATPWHVHETHDEYFYILEGGSPPKLATPAWCSGPAITPSARAASRMAIESQSPARRVFS